MQHWRRFRLLLVVILTWPTVAAERESDEVCYLRTSAENGDLYARWQLTLRLCHSSPRDYVEAAQQLMIKAQQGDGDAADMLGQLYVTGEGVPKNYNESVRWLKRGVELGSIYAQHHLAQRYELGGGVLPNFSEAYFWYVTSAALQLNDGFRLITMKRRDLLEKKLSREAIAEAQNQSKQWVDEILKGGGGGPTTRDPIIPAAPDKPPAGAVRPTKKRGAKGRRRRKAPAV